MRSRQARSAENKLDPQERNLDPQERKLDPQERNLDPEETSSIRGSASWISRVRG